jgi:DNA-binding LytR/AlgR family response regulator
MNKNISVLIVEDDIIWQKIISSAIVDAGYQVASIAKNMNEALLLINNLDFDIALVDIFLGDQSSGLILGKVIRQKYNKPFIFITSSVDTTILDAALLANPSCYLTKPISKDALILNIKNSIYQFNQLLALSNSLEVNKNDLFFFAKNGKQLKRIEWRDVICLKSDRNYTKVITQIEENYMIRCSLQNAITHVIPNSLRTHFLQINRAEVLQVSHIKEIINNTVIINSKEFEVSENYIKNFKQKINIIT